MQRDGRDFLMSFYIFKLDHPSIPLTPPSPPAHPLLHFHWHHIYSPYPNALALPPFFSINMILHISFFYIILCHRVPLQPRYGRKWHENNNHNRYIVDILMTQDNFSNSQSLLWILIVDLPSLILSSLFHLLLLWSSCPSSSHHSLCADDCSFCHCFWLWGLLDDLINNLWLLDRQDERGNKVCVG